MHKKSPPRSDLAHRLISAMMPLMKGSQAEVMSATGASDLTLTQLRMMFVLERDAEDLPVNVLAERLGLSVAATGRAVDAMVRATLLSRREDAVDRRIKRIGLTSDGRNTIEQLGLARRQAVESFVARLDADECAALESAVATLGALTAAHLPALGRCSVASHTNHPSGKTQ